ncbi:hypothetical protein TNCV_1070181 [Trichonephila clavipes]|nr:hypothetical protein TNCV_1070181 [Trichonephila clavipes]
MQHAFPVAPKNTSHLFHHSPAGGEKNREEVFQYDVGSSQPIWTGSGLGTIGSGLRLRKSMACVGSGGHPVTSPVPLCVPLRRGAELPPSKPVVVGWRPETGSGFCLLLWEFVDATQTVTGSFWRGRLGWSENESSDSESGLDKTNKELMTRYLNCPAALTVSNLKKFIRMKFSLPQTYRDYSSLCFTNPQAELYYSIGKTRALSRQKIRKTNKTLLTATES